MKRRNEKNEKRKENKFKRRLFSVQGQCDARTKQTQIIWLLSFDSEKKPIANIRIRTGSNTLFFSDVNTE